MGDIVGSCAVDIRLCEGSRVEGTAIDFMFYVRKPSTALVRVVKPESKTGPGQRITEVRVLFSVALRGVAGSWNKRLTPCRESTPEKESKETSPKRCPRLQLSGCSDSGQG